MYKIVATLALLCAWTIHAAELPSSLPVGDDTVRAYRIASIQKLVINLLYSPTPTTNGQMWIIGYYQTNYIATNGVVNMVYVREEIRKFAELAPKNSTNVYAIIAGLNCSGGDGAYAGMNSGEYSWIVNPDGSYSLPAQATNAPLVEYDWTIITIPGITQARVEVYWRGRVDYTWDSEPGGISTQRGVCAFPTWMLTSDYEGVITIWSKSGTQTTQTRYDLKTGQREVPLVLSSPVMTSQGMRFVITGKAGKDVFVQRSSDLKVWNTGTNLSNPTGTITFVDTVATGTCSYYRVGYLETSQ